MGTLIKAFNCVDSLSDVIFPLSLISPQITGSRELCFSSVLPPDAHSHYKEKGVATFPSLLILIRLAGPVLESCGLDPFRSGEVERVKALFTFGLVVSGFLWLTPVVPACQQQCQCEASLNYPGRSTCQGKYSLMTALLPKNTLFQQEELNIYHGYFIL